MTTQYRDGRNYVPEYYTEPIIWDRQVEYCQQENNLPKLSEVIIFWQN